MVPQLGELLTFGGVPFLLIEVKKGPSNSTYLSIKVMFHFHDYLWVSSLKSVTPQLGNCWVKSLFQA